MLNPDVAANCCIDKGWAVNAVGELVAPLDVLHKQVITSFGIPLASVTTPKSMFPCECGNRVYLEPGTMGPCCMEAARRNRLAIAAEVLGEAATDGAAYPCACGEVFVVGPGPAVLDCCVRHGYSVAPGGGILHVSPELSSDILDSDLDKKETAMTDTSTTTTMPDPIPAGPETLRVTSDDCTFVYTAHDATTNTVLIDKTSYNPTWAAFLQKARRSEATGVLGLYLEAVAHTSAGKPFNHLKFFVIAGSIYVYNRGVGETRANWKIRKTPSLHSALNLVQEAINKPSVKVFGHPILVELTADDLSAVESGAMPPARFRGQYRIERDYGRYDFEMAITSKAVPARLVKLLTDGFVTTEDESAPV
jgi:hypothetical protein